VMGREVTKDSNSFNVGCFASDIHARSARHGLGFPNGVIAATCRVMRL